MDLSPSKTLLYMSAAHILVESKSGFSRWAAVLGTGIVLTPKRGAKATGEEDVKSGRFLDAPPGNCFSVGRTGDGGGSGAPRYGRGLLERALGERDEEQEFVFE